MKDWFKQTQRALLNIVPKKEYEEDEQRRSNGTASEQQDVGYDGGAIPASMRAETFDDMETRPASLIIRDYREAEIRHGRLVSTSILSLDDVSNIIASYVQSLLCSSFASK